LQIAERKFVKKLGIVAVTKQPFFYLYYRSQPKPNILAKVLRNQEGGELRSTGPTEGKAKPGMTFAVRLYRQDSELTICINFTAVGVLGSIVIRQSGCYLIGL